MSTPDGLAFGDAIPEADVADQRTPVYPDDQDTWQDASAISRERTWDANEADLVDQAIEVPIPDDDLPLE
ncbi:hypothetical protein AU190_00250 [Mycolicibacterium acapulense]|uniref:hypothetical protein n=1 Tax=Mycobacterium TaxID=1763 RepID=UPI000748A276|nr:MULTISPECIES: hypothetical protein [Mycobacterium]KUI01076.1 hypothetical protein AU189_12090 [Mycolicibacterium acapulense]KUI06363.1 hypothetical protein AU190_00250 [Mycolicibacterium acapulense]KUI13677.1 hypothetical protein AU191_17250 [Mycolicibacterium acapulense]OBB70809.1 hypothetical protein A5759_24180 [Mycobacterium sp. 852014-52144_SCH5372336]